MKLSIRMAIASLVFPVAANAAQDIGTLAVTKGANAAALELSKGDDKALRFLARVKVCSKPDFRVAMKLYGQSVNASAIPLLATALNGAIAVCPAAVLGPLSPNQIREVCSSYATFVESDISDEAEIAAHYVSQSRALGRVPRKLTVQASECRASQRAPEVK